MSFTSPGTFRNSGTGAHSLVSLLIISAVPTPQFGWHPQLTMPHCASGPLTKSAKSANAPNIEMGNQSRVGSVMPVCFFTAGKVRQRVALAQTALRGDVLIAPGKGNRLEGHEGDLLGILAREVHNGANLVVVHVIHD